MISKTKTMKLSDIPLNPEWAELLNTEFNSPSMLLLEQFINEQLAQNVVIYPRLNDIFSAFNMTPLTKVKVVILGQDPYHGEGQAHGLSFSVPTHHAIPPSLRNIYKELQVDVNCTMPEHGNLSDWAEQGVFLLNTVLTVTHASAGSHQKRGWEVFTDTVISLINQQCDGVVFMLWGAHAQKKGRVIDASKHLVLSAPHPSPLSSYRGFFGCQHFSKANDYLHDSGRSGIDWQIR